MATDPNPALRAELLAALGVMVPEVQGLTDFGWMQSLSPAAHEAINNQILERSRRRDLIKAVIASLDDVIAAMKKLEADGYPALPIQPDVPADVLQEIQDQAHDITTAANLFGAMPVASTLTVSLGEPVVRP